MTNCTKRLTGCLTIALLMLGMITAGAPAAVFTWNGGSASTDNWSDDANWGGTALDNDGTAVVHFAGATRTTPNVNAAWSVGSITFDNGAAAFNIGGSTISLTGSGSSYALTNNSTNTQTIAADVSYDTFRKVEATAGDIQLTGQWTLNNVLDVRGDHDLIMDGKITGASSVRRLAGTGSGAIYFGNNTNDFGSGSVIEIQQGMIVAGSIADAGNACALGAGNALRLGYRFGDSDITFRYTGATASTDRDIQMATQSGANNRITIEIADAATTLTFNGAFGYFSSSVGGQWRLLGAGNGVINGNITTAGASLEKDGAGTWTLNGANTYAGATEVKGGTLVLGTGGSIDNSTSVTVDADAVLDTTSQSFVMSGSQAFTFSIDPTGSGSAGLLDAGELNISAGSISFNPLDTLDDSVYVLANYTSLVGGSSFASVGTVPTGYELQTNYGGNQIALVMVPEPATVALLGLGGVLMLRRRRA
ncbi:MAG: autotransporter-associated beta strand repeat-containing protein [Phycisphaerae bacterium]|nr:autotransporter-associated beta strand repeat-containing protein [Phycisphaerae bacterium]